MRRLLKKIRSLLLLPIFLAYGGQAVMGGVMMRGSRSWAISLNIGYGTYSFLYPHRALTHGRIGRIPFLRGVVAMLDALLVGVQGLLVSLSAEKRYWERWDEELQVNPMIEKPRPVSTRKLLSVGLPSWLISIGLFKMVPAVSAFILPIESGVAFAAVEAAIRVTGFVGFILLLSLFDDAKELFSYHGAEHQVINAHEAGETLQPDRVFGYSVIHPRCGTAFILWVATVSFVIYAFLGRLPLGWLLLSRVLCLPIIIGLSYEVVRFVTAHLENPLIRVLMAPGLWLQRLTTRAPAPWHSHTALLALHLVLKHEEMVGVEQDVEVLA